MAKIVFTIEDLEDEKLNVKFTSDTPLPEKFEDWTLAQILAGRLHDLIDRLFQDEAAVS